MGNTVSAAYCPLREYESSDGRGASTVVHARRMPQTKWNNVKMEKGI